MKDRLKGEKAVNSVYVVASVGRLSAKSVLVIIGLLWLTIIMFRNSI